MKITTAFILRLNGLLPVSRNNYFEQNKSDIDFTNLIKKAKQMQAEAAELILVEDNDKIKKSNEILIIDLEHLIDDAILYAAVELYPAAIEGPFLHENSNILPSLNEIPLKNFS